MSLRPYQETAVASALDALARSGSAVLQMPTGAGKTKAATEIIRRAEGVVWFICHRQEIERQAAKAFRDAGIDFGIVSPRAEPDYTKRVQIVSVAIRDMASIPAPSLVIWDECHHVPAKSWAALHARLKDSQHLGLTATPERLDGKGLKDWFAELVVGPSIETLIADSYLSPFRYFAPSDPDLTAAKLQAGDYSKRDADAAMNTPVLIGDAVTEYRRSSDGKRAIAFCTSVEASMALVDRFNADGIPAAHVDGETDDATRLASIAALKDGSVRVLSNVNVFTEGFDVPGIEAVILMRPTKSPTLLLQMIGRALRPVEGKTAIIMDHAGLHHDHGWFANEWHWSIDGGASLARRIAGARGPRRCPECKEVRSERLDVCGCGYEFPTGREIGEYDGVLHEVRGELPKGCVTVAEFARRHATSSGGISQWSIRGLPRRGVFVPVEEGDAWVSRNINKEDPRRKQNHQETGWFESQAAFAARMGCSGSLVSKWLGDGIPNVNRWIHIEDGLKWVSERLPPGGAITLGEYAKSRGVTASTVRNWILRGAPAITDRVPMLVITDDVDKWVSENANRHDPRSIKNLAPPSGFCTARHFAKMTGVNQTTVNKWRLMGLPHNASGHIKIEGAMQWVSDKTWVEGFGRESQSVFGKRVGVTQTCVSRWVKKRGLPLAPNGWVHIQRGLEWVRDNTTIQIPPEAWPSANDNTEKHQAAA